ncbi:MAG: hypothetical protein KJO53_15280 [Eudoraea sp.]|nr:hypothetical protein [Eudoraea sp.]
MKTTYRILILLVVLSFTACKEKSVPELTGPELPVTIYSNQIHVITLYVNTTDILKPNIGDYANFRQPSNISNEDYTTYVRKGDIVIWKGVSTTDSSDVVNITSINHHRGAKFFGKNMLKGNDGDPEVVVGVVAKDSEMVDGTLAREEKYTLKFTVMNNGTKRNGTFQIDPVLKAYR